MNEFIAFFTISILLFTIICCIIGRKEFGKNKNRSKRTKQN